jgi:NAD(P)-dependent dehydrogenase (short-subunit alcohol dehydrogenase family)
MDLNLSGRVVLVTGASRGIGRAIAALAADEGAHVVILGRDGAACAAAADAIGRDRATPLACDVSDFAEAARAVETTVERLGRLDAVVNNAGRFGGGPVLDLDPAALREGLDTKVGGALALVQAALPALRRSDQASIVNISGISAQKVLNGAAVTAIANAGVTTLTAYLANALVDDGITANCVIPGYVLTDPWRARTQAVADAEGVSFEAALQLVLDRQGLGHSRWGTPEEIAGVVVFLLSRQARFVNGAAFRVDGAQFPAIQG